MNTKNASFSVQNVLNLAKDFQKKCQDGQWKQNFEIFKNKILSTWNYVFVQEHPGQKMVQVTYMHPMITKKMSRDRLLAVTKPYPIHAMTIHIPSRQLVYCFGPKSYVYSADETESFVGDTL